MPELPNGHEWPSNACSTSPEASVAAVTTTRALRPVRGCPPVVAIVALDRAQAMGQSRRTTSWRAVFEAAGAHVHDVLVPVRRRPHLDGLAPVVSGHAAPERLAWSAGSLAAQLQTVGPDVVIAVTTRAFDPRVLDGPWTVVLDQVDSLARSYRDRAALTNAGFRRGGYRALAALHGRVERTVRADPVRRVAAGWTDAQMLGAEWVPNVVDDRGASDGDAQPDRDVLFVGTLRYPPNVDALERLGRLWPTICRVRPGTTALVAGATPVRRVHELCARHGWELLADFASLAEVAARARVSVAPVQRVAGIQNKVLDAADVGLAQVVTPEVLEGFAPGVPLTPMAGDTAFAAEVVRLLDDAAARAAQVQAVQDHMRSRYASTAWSGWATELLDAR